jgi:hypothetical protein
MKSGGTPVPGHISFMMPFLSTVSITEENYMPRKLKYSSF